MSIGLRKFRISLLFPCFVVVWMGPNLSAQETPKVYEKLNVKLKQLQVNVVTKKGESIKGLGSEDFQVIVAGKKQTIVDVSEISLDNLATSDSPQISELGRRLFVFLFDLRYTTRLGLLNARASAADYVTNQLTDQDISAVISYHPEKGMELLCPFTDDRQLLHQAVHTLGLVTTTQRGRAGYYNSNAFERNFVNLDKANAGIDALAETGVEINDAPGAPEEVISQLNEQRILEQLGDLLKRAKRVEEDIYRSDVNRFLLQFQFFANALNQIRGRKNLVWFSAGFDEKVLTGNSSSQNRDDSEAISRGEIWEVSSDATGNVGIQSNLADAVKFLQGSNTIIFAVDTSLNENATGGQSGLQSLNAFAKDTGGKLFRNSNDLSEPLDEIRAITSHYYLVTFEPSQTLKKGEPLKMRVKASAKGAQVYANRSVTIDEDFSKLSDLARTFHISDYLARDLVSDDVPFACQKFLIPSSKGLKKVMVMTDIEKDYLQNLGSKDSAQFEVFVQAIRQSDASVYDSFYFRFGVDSKKINKSKNVKGLRYFSDLFLAPDDYRIKVVVRDLKNGKVGSQIDPLTVESASEPLSGPFVMSEDPWVYIRPDEKTQKAQRGVDLDYSYPFQIQGKMQVPTQQAAFSTKSSYGFYFLLNQGGESAATQEPKMNAVFMDDQQQIIQIPAGAIMAGSHFGQKAPYLTGLMFKIDFSKVNLQAGKTYRFLSQFVYPNQKPFRSMHTIQTAP